MNDTTGWVLQNVAFFELERFWKMKGSKTDVAVIRQKQSSTDDTSSSDDEFIEAMFDIGQYDGSNWADSLRYGAVDAPYQKGFIRRYYGLQTKFRYGSTDVDKVVGLYDYSKSFASLIMFPEIIKGNCGNTESAIDTYLDRDLDLESIQGKASAFSNNGVFAQNASGRPNGPLVPVDPSKTYTFEDARNLNQNQQIGKMHFLRFRNLTANETNVYQYQFRFDGLLTYYNLVLGTEFKSFSDIDTNADYLKVRSSATPADVNLTKYLTTGISSEDGEGSSAQTEVAETFLHCGNNMDFNGFVANVSTKCFPIYTQFLQDGQQAKNIRSLDSDLLMGLINTLWADGYFIVIWYGSAAPTAYPCFYAGYDGNTMCLLANNREDYLKTTDGYVRTMSNKIFGISMFKDTTGTLVPTAGSTFVPEVSQQVMSTLAGLTGDVGAGDGNPFRFTGLIPEWDNRSGLGETDLSTLMPNREDLRIKDQSSLNTWIENVERENALIRILRIGVQIVGIAFLIWSILVYLAYWFDRMNTFFEISVLTILTMGKLAVSDTEDECTYGNKGSGMKTVNHKAILKICIIGVAFSTFVLSGLLYKALCWVVFQVVMATR